MELRSRLLSGVFSFTSMSPYHDIMFVRSDACDRLLGWSAFAGSIVLLVGWPLNNFMARRSIRIQKGVLAARDKRMGVLNELIGAVSNPGANYDAETETTFSPGQVY